MASEGNKTINGRETQKKWREIKDSLNFQSMSVESYFGMPNIYLLFQLNLLIKLQ